MSRTPIPDGLIHKPAEVEENAKLFDAFASLVDVPNMLKGSTRKELREMTASMLLEKLRRRVSEDGKIKLPFGLIIQRSQESRS